MPFNLLDCVICENCLGVKGGGVTKIGRSLKTITYILDLPWFVVGYDFYPTSCLFSIPEPWKKNNELDKNPIQPQTMEDSFYHMLQHYFYFHINFMKPFTCKSSKRHFNSKYVIIHALCCHVIAVRGIWILWIIII